MAAQGRSQVKGPTCFLGPTFHGMKLPGEGPAFDLRVGAIHLGASHDPVIE